MFRKKPGSPLRKEKLGLFRSNKRGKIHGIRNFDASINPWVQKASPLHPSVRLYRYGEGIIPLQDLREYQPKNNFNALSIGALMDSKC